MEETRRRLTCTAAFLPWPSPAIGLTDPLILVLTVRVFVSHVMGTVTRRRPSRSSKNSTLARYKPAAAADPDPCSPLLLFGLPGLLQTSKMSIDSGPYTFHYVIEHESICYLTLCDKGYPKRLAFLYLEEIHNEFVQHLTETEQKKAEQERRQVQEWHSQINTVARPYAFIKFDKTIKKKGKE